MTDERRLKFLQEYLASDQTKREFERANGLGRNRILGWLRIFAIEDKKSIYYFNKLYGNITFKRQIRISSRRTASSATRTQG